MISFQSSKWIWLAVTILVLASLLGLFLHHHHDGEEVHDCPACRLAQVFSLFFFAALFLLIEPLLSRASWLPVSKQRFYSFLGVSSLQGRAPPVLSF